MKRLIRRGLGKFTPAVWRDMWDLIKMIDTDGQQVLDAAAGGQQFGQDVKIILAKITGYAADVRDTYMDLEGISDAVGVRNRWVYDWHQVVPDPALSGRFVDVGSADYGGLPDLRFKHWGKTSGSNVGLGPAYNLMEQNNRSLTQSTTYSAPGFPHHLPGRRDTPTPSGHLTDAFQEPAQWSVLPIQGNPIAVMYLVRSDAGNQYDHEGSEVDSDLHRVTPTFFLTNALGRLHYRDDDRGQTCTGWS